MKQGHVLLFPFGGNQQIQVSQHNRHSWLVQVHKIRYKIQVLNYFFCDFCKNKSPKLQCSKQQTGCVKNFALQPTAAQFL